MRVIPARGVCSFVKRGNDQVCRIRIILFSVKLRVLNPNLFLKPPHKTKREIKKDTSTSQTHHQECLPLLARKWSFRHPRRYALSRRRFGRFWSSRRCGCPVDDDGIFLLFCLLFAFRDCLSSSSSSSSSVVVCVRDREKLYPF